MFQVFKDKAGEWRWRLRAANGRVIADGSEGYVERVEVFRAIQRVKEQAPGAGVEDADA